MRISRRYSQPLSILLLTGGYVTAMGAAMLVFILCPGYFSPVLSSLLADIGAALVIYLFSVAFNNSSFYDPYWSVAPFIMAIYWSVTYGNPSSTTDTIILLVVLLWSLRLTLNFLRGWKGIRQEDWRYVQLRQRNPKTFQLINLLGIHLFPTVIVFCGTMPVYVYLHRANIAEDYNYIFWGATMAFAGTLIELIADEQLRAFRKVKGHTGCIRTGLWRYSRHPNYFGEIIYWWGLWVMMMGVNQQFWWTGFGALGITLMFIFISIPMMETRALQTKPGYAAYLRGVSMLIPWFPSKKQQQ